MASAALLEATKPKKKTIGNKYAFTCAILASMASITLGYDTGVMSGASLYIKKDLKITDVQVEILIGILNLYSLIGCYAAGWMSDRIGRRFTIVFAAAFFFAGALMMGLAGDYTSLMAGRFAAGVGVGYAVVIAPLYIAEISPASARGFLTSFGEVSINLGILLGYIANYAFARLPLHLGWRVMFAAGAVAPVLLVFMVFRLPESPRWLVMKGRLAEARAVLVKISDTPEEAAERLADIKAAAGIPGDLKGDVITVPKGKSIGEKQVWKELILSRTVRRILLTAVGLHFFQQASGAESVVVYSPRVFQSAGVTGETQLLATTCAVGITKTLFILVATVLLDRVGRRPLLLSSTAGVAVSLVGLGTGLIVVGRHPDAEAPSWAAGLCVVSTLAVVSFFSIGLGPMASVYSSEIFPLRVRALGYAIGVACNRVVSGVVSMTFLSLSSGITIGGSFFLYAGIVTLAWGFFYTCLPETRGRTLEEMGELFGRTDRETEAEDEPNGRSRLLGSN